MVINSESQLWEVCQRHGLAVPRAGDRSYVTGSIRGWSQSRLTYLTGGCWLEECKLTSQSPSITVELSVQYNLKITLIYLFHLGTTVLDRFLHYVISLKICDCDVTIMWFLWLVWIFACHMTCLLVWRHNCVYYSLVWIFASHEIFLLVSF